jgi:hypothetical protein
MSGWLRQPFTVSFNSNFTIGYKPDVFYQPVLPSEDFIGVETFLFDKGFYKSALNSKTAVVSPVINALNRKRLGFMTDDEFMALISDLKDNDVRTDQAKYAFRHTVNKQIAVSIRGGNARQHGYLSIGYDNNSGPEKTSTSERLTINGNTYYTNRKNLEITGGIAVSMIRQRSDFTPYAPKYPYLQFVDENGNALPVPVDYKMAFADSAGNGKLLDWHYRPIDEMGADYRKNLIDYRLNVKIEWKILKSLRVGVIYYFNKGISEGVNFYDRSSYFTRNLVNRYSQIDPTTGIVTRPVPEGGILIQANEKSTNNSLRGQVIFEHTYGKKHVINVASGAEIRDYNRIGWSPDFKYGYDQQTGSATPVDFQSEYPIYYTRDSVKIPNSTRQNASRVIDRLRFFYVNLTYAYDSTYIVNLSARRDESNFFGLKTNQKGVPLWAIGVAMNLHNTHYFHINWLTLLKLRFSYGYNGNVDRSISPYTTSASYGQVNSAGAPILNIVNPPNSSLRWEKVRVVNVGIDFATKKRMMEGSIDFFQKAGQDLMGYDATAPQLGVSAIYGNNAGIQTKGMDIYLHSRNSNGELYWFTDLLFSVAKDKITRYGAKQGSNYLYIIENQQNPMEGKPYSPIFSFSWAGLNNSGNPQSFLNKTKSTNYTEIKKSTDISELVYNGPANPTMFGSIRNTLGWKGFEFSFNIMYKGGYYFRRNALDYLSLYNGNFRYSSVEFNNRWKVAGDEKTTNVPAMNFPAPGSDIYKYAEINVEKGDHIRLQDIQFSYTVMGRQMKRNIFNSCRLYVYANNIGILWKATDYKIDPDYVNGMPAPLSISIGLNAEF